MNPKNIVVNLKVLYEVDSVKDRYGALGRIVVLADPLGRRYVWSTRNSPESLIRMRANTRHNGYTAISCNRSEVYSNGDTRIENVRAV